MADACSKRLVKLALVSASADAVNLRANKEKGVLSKQDALEDPHSRAFLEMRNSHVLNEGVVKYPGEESQMMSGGVAVHVPPAMEIAADLRKKEKKGREPKTKWFDDQKEWFDETIKAPERSPSLQAEAEKSAAKNNQFMIDAEIARDNRAPWMQYADIKHADADADADAERSGCGKKEAAIGVVGATALGGAAVIAHHKGFFGATSKSESADNDASPQVTDNGSAGGMPQEEAAASIEKTADVSSENGLTSSDAGSTVAVGDPVSHSADASPKKAGCSQ